MRDVGAEVMMMMEGGGSNANPPSFIFQKRSNPPPVSWGGLLMTPSPFASRGPPYSFAEGCGFCCSRVGNCSGNAGRPVLELCINLIIGQGGCRSSPLPLRKIRCQPPHSHVGDSRGTPLAPGPRKPKGDCR